MTTNTDLHGAMPELLPCPFCGGKPAFVPRAVNIVLQKDPSAPKFGVSVICGQCSSESPNMVDEAHAANKWNRRAAIEQAAVPEGFQIVPIEPTPHMLFMASNVDGQSSKMSLAIWQEMLEAASPAPPKQQPVHLAGGECGGVLVPLTLAQIDLAVRNAQLAFCLDKFTNFEIALTRKVEAAHGIKEAS